MLGGSVLFSCLITTTNALLQSYRRQSLPIVSMSLGVAVKLVSTYALVRVADIGVMGAPIGSLLCNITVSYMNLYFLWKHSALRLNAWGTLFKPLIASTFSLGVGFALYRFLLTRTDGMLLPFSAAACSSVILYITVSVLIGCITEDDIRLLPLGARIINIKKDKNKTA
jgi:stage V sporulation protein B